MTKKVVLSTKEFYGIVGGIVLILLGGMWIPLNIPPTTDSNKVFLILSILSVLAGIFFEARSVQKIKQKLTELEDRIKDLEKSE